MADNRRVTTIEGLAGASGELYPMQQAFIDFDAFQCGYCNSGPDHVGRRLRGRGPRLCAAPIRTSSPPSGTEKCR
jgi:hypothetical protein